MALEAVGARRRQRKEISEHERTEAAMPKSPRSYRSPVLPIAISFAIDFIYQINVDYHCQRYLVQRPTGVEVASEIGPARRKRQSTKRMVNDAIPG